MPQDQNTPHKGETETRATLIVERILAYCTVGIIALAVLAYLTTLIVAMVAGREALAESMWPIVTWIAFYGLPIGFLMLLVLLGMSFRRRGKAQ